MSLLSNLDNSVNSVIDLTEEDILSVYDTFVSSDKLSNARQLLNLVRNKKIDRLPEDVINHLVKTTLDEKARPRVKEICLTILEHFVKLVKIPTNKENVDASALADCTQYLLLQSHETSHDTYVINKFLSALNDPHFGSAVKIKILSFFSRLAAVRAVCFSSEIIQDVTSFLLQWLHGSNSSETFSKTPYTELDGAPSQDLFTVLNLVQNFNSDHMLHYQVFSMMKLWLHNCHGLKFKKNQNEKVPPHENVTFPAGTIKKLLDYCLRLIDQISRSPPKTADIPYQNACLIEAVNIMNMICLFDESYIPVIYQVVRRVYDKSFLDDRIQIQPEHFAVVMECLQFFFDHGQVVGFDALTSLELILKSFTHKDILESFGCFNLVSFLKENHANICDNSELFEKYFPTILKLFAWHPSPLIDEFMVLVPTFISVTTAIEVFHSIIDLPCVSGALFLENYSSAPHNEPNQELVQIQGMSDSPSFRPMFNFILRSESGIGDTFSKIGEFHQLLNPLVRLKCIEGCSGAACDLLEEYFRVILLFLDFSLASRIMPAILERSVLLLNVSGFVGKMQRIMDNAMLKIIKQYPTLLVDHQVEFLDYVSTVRHLTLAESIYSHVVWFFGEYMSTIHLETCQADLITTCYAALECVMYEVVGSHKNKAYSYRIICVLAMSLSKLSSRCQDLVPRVMLCLTKVIKESGSNEDGNQEYREIVCNRLNELMVVLKMPNITSAVFSPSKEIENGEWHRDSCSATSVVKSMNTILGQDFAAA